MRAAVFFEHGPSEKLQIIDIDIPKMGENDILVKVGSFVLNRLDLWTRNGSPHLKITLPHIGVSDFAGIVEKLGGNVTDL